MEVVKVGPVEHTHLGYVYLTTDAFVAKVGSRWYLTSGRWNGTFQGTSPRVASLIVSGLLDVNQDGASPIHVAAFHAKMDVLRTLLHEGANPSAMTAEGETVLAYAFSGFESRRKATPEELMRVVEASL